jgi:hypothetical protein
MRTVSHQLVKMPNSSEIQTPESFNAEGDAPIHENHCHMVAIYYAYYNFCRVHQTLRVTSAMEAGLTDHVWSLVELVNLLDASSTLAA